MATPRIDYSGLPSKTWNIPGADGYPVSLDTSWGWPILRGPVMGDEGYYVLMSDLSWAKFTKGTGRLSGHLDLSGSTLPGTRRTDANGVTWMDVDPASVVQKAASFIEEPTVVAGYLGTVVPALQADG